MNKSYSPPPPKQQQNSFNHPFLSPQKREVVGAEACKSEISAPKTSLLFAQRCKSTYILLQYFPHL